MTYRRNKKRFLEEIKMRQGSVLPDILQITLPDIIEVPHKILAVSAPFSFGPSYIVPIAVTKTKCSKDLSALHYLLHVPVPVK